MADKIAVRPGAQKRPRNLEVLITALDGLDSAEHPKLGRCSASEEAEEFGGWWWGRRWRWSKEHGEALVVVVPHTCGDEDGDADEQQRHADSDGEVRVHDGRDRFVGG